MGAESVPRRAAKADYPPEDEKISRKEAEQWVVNTLKERNILERVQKAHQEARIAAGEANKTSFFKGGTPLKNPLIKEMVRLGELAQVVEYLSTKAKGGEDWKIPTRRHLREGEAKPRTGLLTSTKDFIIGNEQRRVTPITMGRADYERLVADIEKHAVFHEDLSAGPDNAFLNDYPELFKKFIVTKTKQEKRKADKEKKAAPGKAKAGKTEKPAERVIDITPKPRPLEEEPEREQKDWRSTIPASRPPEPEETGPREIDLGRRGYTEPPPLKEDEQETSEESGQEREDNVQELHPEREQSEALTLPEYEAALRRTEKAVVDAIEGYEKDEVPLYEVRAALLDYRAFLKEHNPGKYERLSERIAGLEALYLNDTPKKRNEERRTLRRQARLDARDKAAEKRNTPKRIRSDYIKGLLLAAGLLTAEAAVGYTALDNGIRYEDTATPPRPNNPNAAPRIRLRDRGMVPSEDQLHRLLQRERASSETTPTPNLSQQTSATLPAESEVVQIEADVEAKSGHVRSMPPADLPESAGGSETPIS